MRDKTLCVPPLANSCRADRPRLHLGADIGNLPIAAHRRLPFLLKDIYLFNLMATGCLSRMTMIGHHEMYNKL